MQSNTNTRDDIETRFIETMNSLLRFKASYDLQLYRDISQFSYRDIGNIEQQMHAEGYPVHGTGIKFNRGTLLADREELYEDHLLTEELLSPEEATQTASLFPFQAASASYCFSVMEIFGDFCSDIVSSRERNRFSAWHKGVHSNTRMESPDEKLRARSEYVKLLGDDAGNLVDVSILRLKEVKEVRNAYTHRLEEEVDFERFYENILLTIYQVAIVSNPTIREIELYPFYDYSGTFKV